MPRRKRTPLIPRHPILVVERDYGAAARRLNSFIRRTEQTGIEITPTLVGHWIQEIVDAALINHIPIGPGDLRSEMRRRVSSALSDSRDTGEKP